MDASDALGTFGGIPVVTDPNAPPGYAYSTTTTTNSPWTIQPQWDQPMPPRRGHPRHHIIVWLERDDEPIPPPWTDCVTHRFFDPATASFGVIVESPDIPWITSPGMHLMEYPSWEALDVAIRQHT